MITTGKRPLQHPAAGRTLFLLSAIASAYFFTMPFLAGHRSDFVLIGVAVELLTLPMLLALAVSAVGSAVLLFRRQHVGYPLCTLLLSLLTFIFAVWK